jgi:hypothetical protein
MVVPSPTVAARLERPPVTVAAIRGTGTIRIADDRESALNGWLVTLVLVLAVAVAAPLRVRFRLVRPRA